MTLLTHSSTAERAVSFSAGGQLTPHRMRGVVPVTKATMSILEGEPVILFSPVLAKAFGHCGALLIQQIHYWVNTVEPKERNGFKYYNVKYL